MSVAQTETKTVHAFGTEVSTGRELPHSEKAQPVRTEVLQKGNLLVEKRYHSSEPTYLDEKVDISISENGHIIHLNDLLPEGWSIVETYEFIDPHGNLGDKKIRIPKSMLISSHEQEYLGLQKTESSLLDTISEEEGRPPVEVHDYLALRGSLLILLHEIGHIYDHNQLGEAERAHDEAVRQRMYGEGFLGSMDETKLQDFLDVIYRAERGAWMHAFKMYRRVKQEKGIDLAEGMSAAKIIQGAHTCLATYERYGEKIKSTRQNVTRRQQAPATPRDYSSSFVKTFV